MFSAPEQRNQQQKSDNLQYNTLGCWDERLIDQVSDVPSIIFFHNFLQNSLQKSFQFIFLLFHNFTKNKVKSFECPKSIKNYEKKDNAWNIRRLVDSSFVPSTQRASVLQ